MRSLIALLSVGWLMILGPRVLRAQQFVDTRLEVNDTLHDVAVTTIHNGRATIHTNPTLLSLLGPLVSDFISQRGTASGGDSGVHRLTSSPARATLRP